MTAFSCEHCGASLELPADPHDPDAQCPFCGRHTALPRHLLELRRPQVVNVVAPPPSSSFGVTLGLIAGLLALGMGVSLFLLRGERETPRSTTVTPAEASTASAVPASVPGPPRVTNPTDRNVTGEAAVSARLNELHARGCKDVILAPSRTSGDQTVDTRFIMNGRCVTVLAITGTPANVLTLTMSTPLGVPVDVPPPSTHVEVTVCPRMAGQHPTRIVPATDDTYTVAAIECPAGKKTP